MTQRIVRCVGMEVDALFQGINDGKSGSPHASGHRLREYLKAWLHARHTMDHHNGLADATLERAIQGQDQDPQHPRDDTGRVAST